MKTTDATVLDEPKAHRRATEETIEPAIETRPRRTTGVREAKIYIDGKFYSEANAKVSVFDHGLLYGDGIFEGIRFTTAAFFAWNNTWSAYGIQRVRFVSKFP